MTPDELASARDDDAPVELVETGRAVARGPVGLSFALHLDCRPTVRLLETISDALERSGRPCLADDDSDDDPPVT